MAHVTDKHPTAPTNSPADTEQDAVGTPEGDNEYAPDQPLTPSAPTPERPRGNEPHPAQPIYPAQG